MFSNLKFSYLLMFISFVFLMSNCHSGEVTPPKEHLAFPVDTTISMLHSLPSAVNESSGIEVLNGGLWTHNDSGDYPRLYQLSMETGKINKEVTLSNAKAKDWEDMAADEDFVYVGDFGNNGGKRQDLAIYKVAQTELLSEKEEVDAFKLEFTYPDRTDFKPKKYQHNFDCEAIISDGDSLFIFSKNHLDQQSRLYGLSKTEPKQVAHLKARFDTKGTITGAGIDTENKILGLVGYFYDLKGDGYAPFIWFFWDYPNHDYFSGKSQRVNLPVLMQVEGICFWKDGQFLISSEKSFFMPGKLMAIDARKWVGER